MNTNTINSNLIDEIKKKITGPVIDSLIEILPLGRDSIYRRIRGDVAFSYAEAVLIAKKLSISLDQINLNTSEDFSFKMSPSLGDSSLLDLEYFLHLTIERLTRNIENIVPQLYVAAAGIPLSVILSYSSLSKFRIFKWMHENKFMETQTNRLSNIVISDLLQEQLSVFLNLLRQTRSTYILPDTMFENYLKEVKHFVDIGLINQSEIDIIRQDLHALINEFEIIVSSGTYSDGAKNSMYLSDVSVDATFGYLQNGNSEFAFIRTFGMNYGLSQNHQILKGIKDTFENLKDYSTVITKSGSARRTAFFNKQRHIVDTF